MTKYKLVKRKFIVPPPEGSYFLFGSQYDISKSKPKKKKAKPRRYDFVQMLKDDKAGQNTYSTYNLFGGR